MNYLHEYLEELEKDFQKQENLRNLSNVIRATGDKAKAYEASLSAISSILSKLSR